MSARNAKLADSPEWLRREYIDRGRTRGDIGAECGCSANTVGNWLRHHGIETRAVHPAVIAEGDRFGRLVVMAEWGRMYRARAYLCVCDCGELTTVASSNLRSGHTTSCGCLMREASADRTRARGKGHVAHPLYGTYRSMIQRCMNRNHQAWHYYGGRGIVICGRWRGPDGFLNFVHDMGEKPGPEYTLDRYPDNDGNYEPGNCRWATSAQQAANKRPRRKRPTAVAA